MIKNIFFLFVIGITTIALTENSFAQRKKKPLKKPVKITKKIPAEDKENKEDKKGTGIYGKNIKIHIFGGGAITYPGGDIVTDTDANAAGQVSYGYEAGIGISYMFLGDLVGINLSTRYGVNNMTIKYSGSDPNAGTYTYKTSFMDTSIGVKGYINFLFLYYETGLSFGIKPGKWDRESPSGTEAESTWASAHDLNFNISYYIGGGLAWPVTKLISIEFGFRYEVGFISIIEGPTPLDGISDADKLTTRYAGLRAGVTFAL